MLLLYLSSAWIIGIATGFWCHGLGINLPLALILAGLLPLALILPIKKYRRQLILTSLCITTFLSGAAYFQATLPAVNESSLQFYNDTGTLAIKGMVAADPDVRDNVTHINLSVTEIRLDEDWHQVTGTALLYVPRYPTYEYGDVLLVTGNLETPPQFDDFDYRGYLSQQGIYSTMLYPEIAVMESGQGSRFLGWIYSLRNNLSQTLAEVLPEPQASLAQGIILGVRGNIPASIKDDFSRSGTAHLLAISGLHLSIVAGILLSIGIWLFGKRHYYYVWLALSAIWLYAIFTGLNPPIIRAAIMASLFLLAELLGRQRSAITALMLAAAIMAGVNPSTLWNASFQMSFMAMVGLIFVSPRLQKMGSHIIASHMANKSKITSLATVISDSLGISLGVIITVWPVIAYHFGTVSLVAPLSTLLTLPALPAIILTGAISGGLGLIWLPLGQAAGWLAWLFLSYLLLIVKAFAVIPLAAVEIDSINAVTIILYYGTLMGIIWLINHRQLKNQGKLSALADKASGFLYKLPLKWVIPPLLVIAILTTSIATTLPDDKLHVSFLDVGQGDAILIQTPSHHDILVDGGPSPQAITLALSDKMPFWDRTIDLVVLTHPDADHLTGLVEVLRRYEVKRVLCPGLPSDSAIYKEWVDLIEAKDVEVITAQAGQRLELGEGVTITISNPPLSLFTDTNADNDNNGIVMQLEMASVSFLLPTDIRQEAELALINQRANLNSTVLKAGHHGSDTSTSAEFLAVVNPQLVVISAGADNPFGHPSPEVMARLEEKVGTENIYRTDKQGTIEFITDGKRLWVITDKDKPPTE